MIEPKSGPSGDAWGDLMRAALAGDEAAYRLLLTALARDFRVHVQSRLARTGRGNADCEDVVQETLLAIHLKRDTWDRQRAFAPWAYAVLTHKLMDRLRAGRGRIFEPVEAASEQAAPADAEPEAASDVARLLSRLDAPQRRIVESMSIEGRSAAETAQAIGSTEGAVRVALHRALKRLAAMLKEERG